MESMKNTYKQGLATLLVYPEESHYVGVCLQFNLVIEADDTELAKEKLIDAVQSHASTVVRKKYSEDLLNRPAPKKYWDKYIEVLKAEQRQLEGKTPSPTHPLVFVQNIPLSELTLNPSYV